jgi:hypothetical protein
VAVTAGQSGWLDQQLTLNQRVAGSSPAAPTKCGISAKDLVERGLEISNAVFFSGPIADPATNSSRTERNFLSASRSAKNVGRKRCRRSGQREAGPVSPRHVVRCRGKLIHSEPAPERRDIANAIVEAPQAFRHPKNPAEGIGRHVGPEARRLVVGWLARSPRRLPPVAHIIRNDGVGGSNPSCGTMIKYMKILHK